MTRLSTSLTSTAAKFRADADTEIAAGNPESAETLIRLADQLERIATNHRAHAILTDDPAHDPEQVDAIAPPSITLERLKARRESLGLSQAKLAIALGVSKSTVFHWEQGVQRIPGHVVLALDALAARKS